MRDRIKKNHIQQGFSLIELSAIIGVAAALTIGFLSWTQPTGITTSQKNIETQKKLVRIEQALTQFRLVHGRLPCPADPNIRDDNTPRSGYTDNDVNDFGREDLDRTEETSGTKTYGIDCAVNVGILPVHDLHLPKWYINDAWGNRFTYHISSNLCTKDAGTTDLSPADAVILASRLEGCNQNYYYSRNGDLVVTDTTPDPDEILISTAAYVVVSHGANGNGAFLPSGESLANGTGDELENSDGDNNYVKTQYSTIFDDLVVFKTKTQIENAIIRSSKKAVSVADCNANSTLINNISLTEQANLRSNVTDFEIDNQDNSISRLGHLTTGYGDYVVLNTLLELQALCVKYYGIDSGSGWNGAKCPGGSSTSGELYNAGSHACYCHDGDWDSSCEPFPNYSDLIVWLDSRDNGTIYSDENCTTLASNGNTVLCWEDKRTATSNDATETSGGPLYNDDDQLPGLTVSTSNRELNIAYSYDWSTSWTILVAVSNGSTSGGGMLTNKTSVDNNYWRIMTDKFQTGAGSITFENNLVDVKSKVIAIVSDGSTITAYVDGKLDSETLSTSSINNANSNLYLGSGEANNSSLAWDGDIHEVLIFDVALDIDKREYVEGYLLDKWVGSFDWD